MCEIHVRGCYGTLPHYPSAHLGSLAPEKARVLAVSHLKHLCPSSLLPNLSTTTKAGPIEEFTPGDLEPLGSYTLKVRDSRGRVRLKRSTPSFGPSVPMWIEVSL